MYVENTSMIRGGISRISSACCCFFALVVAFAFNFFAGGQDEAPSDGASSTLSQFKVQLRVEDGYFAIDSGDASLFTPSDRFQSSANGNAHREGKTVSCSALERTV